MDILGKLVLAIITFSAVAVPFIRAINEFVKEARSPKMPTLEQRVKELQEDNTINRALIDCMSQNQKLKEELHKFGYNFIE